MDTHFDPVRAIETLRNNAVEIQKLGDELHKLRLKSIIAKAELIDAENLARRLALSDPDLKVSLLRDTIKDGCAKEAKVHELLQEEIRDLKEQMEVKVETNNSLKASHRIVEMEARSLNLT